MLRDENGIYYRQGTPKDRTPIMKVLETANMHHIPSLEIAKFDCSDTFVAYTKNKIVGVGGWRILKDSDVGKTTLLAVDPKFHFVRIAFRLQLYRMWRMYSQYKVNTIITYSDVPNITEWYKQIFGYDEIDTTDKLCEFGSVIPYWTVLSLNTNQFYNNKTDHN